MDQSSQEGRQQSSSSDDDQVSTSSDSALDKKPPADPSNGGKKKVRKKRRAPLVPWKKPKDMPKRPLSAYNLFFQYERERILSAGRHASSPATTEGNQAAGQGTQAPKQSSSPPTTNNTVATDVSDLKKDDSPGDSTDEDKGRKRRHMKTSGIGFANLTKTIAAKWKDLDPETKSFFEMQAVKEKENYRKAVEVWRNKKKEEPTEPVVELEETTTKAKNIAKQDTPKDAVPHAHVFDSNDTGDKDLRNGVDGYAGTNSGVHAIFSQEHGQEPTIHLEEDFLSPANSLEGENVDKVLTMDDVRPCEIMAAEHQISLPPKDNNPSSVVQSSLEVLGSHLDDEDADFLTNLRFDA